jgi:hypothetical protein
MNLEVNALNEINKPGTEDTSSHLCVYSQRQNIESWVSTVRGYEE